MSLRVAIFDDNRNVRQSIALLISTNMGMEVVGSFANVLTCVKDCLECKPDIVLMDIQMPGMNGIEAVLLLKRELPSIQILMQTVFEDEDRVFDAICAGASGYILKDDLKNKLIDAIQELHYGGSPMSPSIARKVINKLHAPERISKNLSHEYKLSPREKEVLLCIVNGLSYKMVAAELFISYETVRSHIKKIYEKLHVASLTEAVAKAIKQGIV